MSVAAKRAELATLLGPLGTVHATVPEAVQPPCAIIQPADPFLAVGHDDVTFGEQHVINFDVLLLTELDDEHDNEQASRALDDQLDELIDIVWPSDGWWVESVGQPGPLATTGWTCHGMRVTVASRYPL